ncbi:MULTISPECIES: fibronectin type III domain-containing protein [unclassified Paenibacillus]|uniref:fibronectin type III domain-containing protein n=1 Tax=unclassified Paenibacillus TaxID=185978 RepID=UPI003631DC77
MKKKLRLLVCYLFLCSLLPINFIFAAIPIDRNGNGIQIDDIVYYLSQTGGSSHSELTNLLNLIDPITPTLKVLAAPANLAATVGDSKINLTWSSVAGATYYNVYQSLDDSTYRLINAPGTITSTTYEVTGLTNGILYYFKASAAKTGAESAYSNVVGATPRTILTAVDVAAGITSVTAPAADATSLSLPTVPPGYTIAIHTSSNTEVVGINGAIAPPADATFVNLVFTVTRTSDNTTANTGIIAVVVPAHVLTAGEVAAGITSVTAPVADAISLSLPTVPPGYTIAMHTSSNTEVVGINGAIVPPAAATLVNLVFTVTRTSDNTTANTGTIAVAVPAHVLTAGEIAAGITSVTAPVADATSLSLPTVPPGYTIAIHTSSNTEVIGINGAIAPPLSPTLVDLVFTITRISDNTIANTGIIAVMVPACTVLPNGGPAGYTFCGNENDTCSFSGTASVAYGANDHFNYKTFTTNTPCTNDVFGDPIGGVVKSCYYQIITTATAGEVAAEITSVTAPAADATSLSLPTVPPAYTIAIHTSSNTEVVGTNGAIKPPTAATSVNLVFTVTRTSDNTTANTGSIAVMVPAHVLTAGEVAAEITSVTTPAPDATSLALPTVPSGYTITIHTSSHTEVVGTNGAIKPPTAATSVNLVFTVTRTSDNTTANTGSIPVAILAYLSTERSGINVALALNGGTASSSTTISSSFTESSINNGDRRGLNWGNGGGWNDGTPDVYPDWVQIDFNGSQAIYGIDVFTIQDNFGNPSEPTTTMTFSQFGITDYTVQYWNGLTWVILTNGNVTENNNVWKQFTFSPVVTNKIRLTITNAKSNFSRVIELEAWTQSSAA